MTLLALLAVCSVLFSQSVSAQNLTASTCVSPSGFNACMATANSYAEACIANTNGDQNKILACGCVANLNEINCALENCWNVVYGCEYQDLAINYVAYCSADAVPFFPAPDNAPGGCSCDLGYVYLNVTNSLIASPKCITGDIGRNDACMCCVQAIGYTALYDICPSVNPNYFTAADILAEVFVVDDPQIDQCGQYFNQYNCVNDLGYPPVGTIPYLTALPATTGTLSYSTTSGSKISSPLSGATFTWTALGQPQVITAAQATKAASSGSAKPTASSSGTHSSTAATASQSMAASSSISSGAAASGSHSSSANQVRMLQSSSFVMVIFAAAWSI